MSDSEPSRFSDPTLNIGGNLPSISFPPLSLPPLKTDSLGMSPMAMPSYPSPSLGPSSISSPYSNYNSPPPPYPGNIRIPENNAFPHQQQQHAPVSMKSYPMQAGPSSAPQFHSKAFGLPSHMQDRDQFREDPRKIKSVPGSPSSSHHGSNPPTPSSVPMMRYNSMDGVSSPGVQQSSPSPQGELSNGHGSSSVDMAFARKSSSIDNSGGTSSQREQSNDIKANVATITQRSVVHTNGDKQLNSYFDPEKASSSKGDAMEGRLQQVQTPVKVENNQGGMHRNQESLHDNQSMGSSAQRLASQQQRPPQQDQSRNTVGQSQDRTNPQLVKNNSPPTRPPDQVPQSNGPMNQASNLSQSQIRTILSQRSNNGTVPSPALQQVLANRNLAQMQHQQRLQQQMQQQQAAMQNRQGLPGFPPNHPQRLMHTMMPPSMMVNRSNQSGAIQMAQILDQRQVPSSSNKEHYRMYKRKFKYLVYENECYQEELRNLQRKLLKLSRDKNFLLDRLLMFEKLSDSSDDDSDASQKTVDDRPKAKKRVRTQRKRADGRGMVEGGSVSGSPSPCPSPAPGTSGNLLTQMLTPSSSGSSQPGPSFSSHQRVLHDHHQQVMAQSRPPPVPLHRNPPPFSHSRPSNPATTALPVKVSSADPRSHTSQVVHHQQPRLPQQAPPASPVANRKDDDQQRTNPSIQNNVSADQVHLNGLPRSSPSAGIKQEDAT